MGPDGILFVGDSVGGAIVALDVDDRTPSKAGATLEIKGINEKIAAMLGTAADQILIQDVVVNPVSKNVYIAVSRGRGADAVPVILRAAPGGKLSEVSLGSIKHMSVALLDTPQQDRQRMETITQLKYVDGKMLVAGLSNEEFSSSLRSIPFPFQAAGKGVGIEIWHGSHGRFETQAPVRTFVPYEINGEKAILAAYTCTPLVRIPVSELKAGNKVKGTTIAELGNRNKPIDMIVYSKDGKNYILMANSSRGVMRVCHRHPHDAGRSGRQSHQPCFRRGHLRPHYANRRYGNGDAPLAHQMMWQTGGADPLVRSRRPRRLASRGPEGPPYRPRLSISSSAYTTHPVVEMRSA